MLKPQGKKRAVVVLLVIVTVTIILNFSFFLSQNIKNYNSFEEWTTVFHFNGFHQPDANDKDNMLLWKYVERTPKDGSKTSGILESVAPFVRHKTPTPYCFFVPPGYKVSAEAILEAKLKLKKHENIASVVSIGQENPLSMTIRHQVLWIHEIKSTLNKNKDCSPVDLTELPFIIQCDTLNEFFEYSSGSYSLLEFFYFIKFTIRSSVVTCSSSEVFLDSHYDHSENSLYKASPDFQQKWDLRDVIDERSDSFGRTHLDHKEIFYCNTTTSKLFYQKYPQKKTAKFSSLHNPRNTLQRWKQVLDEMDLPLIISHGTLLGWARECGFVSHTSDIDTVLPIFSYSPTLKEIAKKKGFQVNRQFGVPPGPEDEKGGFELSFTDIKNKNKIDLFFMYQDMDGKQWTSLWVSKKLRRTYFLPETFSNIIPIDFLGIQVFAPRDYEMALVASYGSKWFEPVSKWDWANSAYNLYRNIVEKWPHPIDIPFPTKEMKNYHRKTTPNNTRTSYFSATADRRIA